MKADFFNLKTIEEKYQWIQDEISQLQSKGISFLWNDIDLSDLFISELVAGVQHADKLKKIDGKAKITKSLKFFFKRIYTNKIKINKKEKLLIFINEPNQWQVIEQVWAVLNTQHISSHIITTKEKIFKQLPAKCLSKSLAYGYSMASQPFNSNWEHPIVKIIQNSLPKIDYLYKYFTNFLDQSAFSYILIGNDITTEGKLLATLAKKYNIQVGTIQHGSINRINPTYTHSTSDDFFVYGEKPAQELNFLGKNKNTIVISGWPLQQEYKWNLSKSKQNEDKRFCSDLLVCFSGPGHSVSEELHQSMISLVKRLQEDLNLLVLIKLHPKDKKEYYSELIKEKTIVLDNTEMNSNNTTILDLFVQTKCTLTIASNAAMESLLAETPVITIDTNQNFQEVDFIQDGLTYHVNSYEELKKTYLELLQSEQKQMSSDHKKKLETYYYNYFNDNYEPQQVIAKKIEDVCAV